MIRQLDVWRLSCSFLTHENATYDDEFFYTKRDAEAVAREIEKLMGPDDEFKWSVTRLAPYESFARTGFTPEAVAKGIFERW